MVVVSGLSEHPCPVTCPQWVRSLSGSHSPNLSPSCRTPAEDSPGRGWGRLRWITATVLSHSCCWWFPLFEKGKSVFLLLFFLCLARCFSSFFCCYLSLRVAVWNKFSGASFCFRWSVLVMCVFGWCFAQVFALGFGVSLPVGKSFSRQVFCFGFVLSFLLRRCFVDVVFVS